MGKNNHSSLEAQDLNTFKDEGDHLSSHSNIVPQTNFGFGRSAKQSSKHLFQFLVYKYVLILVFLLEVLNIASFVFELMSGEYRAFETTANSFSVQLSFWDIYQIYMLYSALTRKDLKKLDKAIRLIKWFLIFVPAVNVGLFYYRISLMEKTAVANISILRQILTLGLASVVIDGIVFLLYLLPAKRLRTSLNDPKDLVEYKIISKIDYEDKATA